MEVMFYEKNGWYGTIGLSSRDNRYCANVGFEMSKFDKLEQAKKFMQNHGYTHNPKIASISTVMPLVVRYKDGTKRQVA